MPVPEWWPIGPAPQMGEWRASATTPFSGRVTAIAFSANYDRRGGQAMFIGIDGGGIWRSTDFQSSVPTWESLIDDLPIGLTSTDRVGLLQISSIVVDYSQPWIVYAGTTAGLVLKSIDAGDSWAALGQGFFSRRVTSIEKIIVDLLNTDTLYVQAALATNPLEWRIAKSADGGRTWLPDDFGPPGGGEVLDIAYGLFTGATGGGRPSGSYLYASVRGAGIFESADGGHGWALTAPTAAGYFELAAMYPATDPDMYAAQVNGSGTLVNVLALDWGNAAWVGVPAGRPPGTDTDASDHFAMGVAPNGTLWVGLEFVHASTDAGTTWQRAGEGHVDQHAFGFHDSDVYNGNDGGIWQFRPSKHNPTTGTWQSLSTGSLQTHLANAVTLSPSNPGIALVGCQDNGTALRSSGQWAAVGGGDGGLVRFVPDQKSQTAYRTYWPPSGGPIFERSDDSGQTWYDKSLEHAGVVVHGDGHTEAAYFAINSDSRYHDRLVMGYHAIYRTMNKGDQWTPISGLLEGAAAVSALAYVSGDVFAGYDNGRVWLQRGGGAWNSLVPAPSPDWGGGAISDIAVHIDSAAFFYGVYVTATGDAPNGGSYSAIWRSPDGGGTWTNITGNLQWLAVHRIEVFVDPATRTTWLLAGTDVGVFATPDPAGSCWLRLGTGMPDVQVKDLQAYPAHNFLAAATYGRGVFLLDLSALGVPVTPTVKIQFAEAGHPVAGQTAHFSLQTSGLTDVPLSYQWRMEVRRQPVGTGTGATFTAQIPVAGVPIVVDVVVLMDGCGITDSLVFTAS